MQELLSEFVEEGRVGVAAVSGRHHGLPHEGDHRRALDAVELRVEKPSAIRLAIRLGIRLGIRSHPFHS